MPLKGNTNVHGSAFAGSLYSLAVLCAWYTLVSYLKALGLDEKYSVVVKSANISYLRVINIDRVVATSMLPDKASCQNFLTALETTEKTTLNITGQINVPAVTGNPKSSATTEEKKAVEYTAVLCAFVPRSSRTSRK